MSEWKTYKLGDVADIIMGQSPSGETCNSEGSGIPLLNGPTEFGTFTPTPVQFTTDPKKMSEIDDILFCVRGSTTGRMNWSNKKYAIGRGLAAIRHKKGEEYKCFLKGLIDFNLNRLLGNATGSTFPNISGSQLKDFEIKAPDLPTQKQIAQILSSLDDKIELNLQMNQTLEAMAQAIFKEWFVHFNYPKLSEHDLQDYGKDRMKNEKVKNPTNQINPDNPVQDKLVDGLPKGWRKEPIDKNIEFLNGLALQKHPPLSDDDFLPVIKIRELRQGVTNSSDKASTQIPEKYVIEDGDILFSWSGSLEVVMWCNGQGALNQHLFKVSSGKYPKWFYYYWTKYFLPKYQGIALDKATTMGHIQRRHLTESIINVPDSDLMKNTNSILEPLLEKLKTNSLQIQSLTQTRDTLLPKLMSGQLEVAI